MKRAIIQRSRASGVVLFVVLSVLAGLSLLGSVAFVIISTDLKMTRYALMSSDAFEQAEAGVYYVRSRIQSDLLAGTLNLSNANVAVNYAAPGGYNFATVTNLTRVSAGENPNPTYSYLVEGRSSNAVARIEASFLRRPSMFGVFADGVFDTKANGGTYSYYSSITTNPTAATSTGDGDVGSNLELLLYANTYIDGDLMLGASASGVAATEDTKGLGQVITGTEGLYVGRIDPDPLGVVSGELAATFTAVALANNNPNALPAIPVSREIKLGAGQTMTLTNGNYYVSAIDMGNNAKLIISNNNGAVNIYLTGSADMKVGSQINVTGKPTQFSLFSNSSSSIRLFHSGDFRGLLYAPLASVEVKNSGAFYGMVWAKNLDIKNSGNIFVDVTLLSTYLSKYISLTSWKEVR